MTTIDGKILADCFALVARCGTELNGLNDMLANMLVEELEQKGNSLPCVLAGAALSESRTDRSDWIYTDIAKCLPLKAKGKGKKSVERYLGYQISMTGDGIEMSSTSCPLLHVFCWSDPVDFRDQTYFGFPFDHDDRLAVIDDRLVLWGDQKTTEWNKREWVYSLRLTALNLVEDLQKYIIEPATALIKGADINVALPDSWLDVVLIRYPTKELLTGR